MISGIDAKQAQSANSAQRGIVLIAGGSGFIGNEVGEHLVRLGWRVRLLMRPRLNPEAGISAPLVLGYPAEVFFWNSDGSVPESALAGLSAVVNFAGESIATKRWTRERKTAIQTSRVATTKALVAGANKFGIKTFVQTSAIGIYGDTGANKVDENTPIDVGANTFLGEVCRQWEAALNDLNSRVTRLVVLRTGVVLGLTGGALPEMLLPYEIGVGAPVGSGRQYLSWIHISDYCRIVALALEQQSELPDQLPLAGVYNAVAPGPVTYNELHRELSKFYSGLPGLSAIAIPGWVMSLGLGEKAAIILQGQRVAPMRLVTSGFKFSFEQITAALSDLLPGVGKPFAGCAILKRKQWLPFSLEHVWDFFSRAENLERITPAFLGFHIVAKTTPEVTAGTELTYRLKVHGLPVKWRSRIDVFEPGKRFIDTQLQGPYKIWHHEHTFEQVNASDGSPGTLIGDLVHFKVPLGRLGRIGGQVLVRRDVEAIFNYRSRVVERLLGGAKQV